MRIVDTSVSWLLGRTPREALLLSIGAGYCIYELLSPATWWPNFGMYALATALFAVRFFPARALAIGVAIGALAMRLPNLRLDMTELSVPHTWAAVGVIAILCSRDLEMRFDRAPSRLSFLPNAWAGLPTSDMRRLRACTYALGALTAQLVYVWGLPPWPAYSGVPVLLASTIFAGLVTIIVLLAWGRALALFLVPLLSVPIAIGLGTQIANAETMLAGSWVNLDYGLIGSPQFVLPAFVLAVLATALSMPYCVRLLRRAI